MQWITLFKKEMMENWRNYKWIWVPLVITLLAIMDPLTTYYMPVILDTVGGLPEGAMFEFPTPSPIEAIMMSLGQLSSLGVLIIILISMQSIAGEIKSQISELVLVKPVRYHNYITSKWVAMLLIAWASLILSLITTWYYVEILFGELGWLSLVQIVFFYGLWFSLIITLSIFYSSLFKSPGLAGSATIGTTILLSVLTNLFGKYMKWSPSNLSTHLQQTLIDNEISRDLLITAGMTIFLIGFIITCSCLIFPRREMIR